MLKLCFRWFAIIGVLFWVLVHGLAQGRTVFGTQIVVGGKPVTQLGFIVADDAGPILVQLKPKGFADERPPRIRRLGVNPAPITFGIGELINAGGRIEGEAVQYYAITAPGADLKPFPLGTAPPLKPAMAGASVVLIWDTERQAPRIVQASRMDDDIILINEPIDALNVIGAPLCTNDGRAYGVVVAPTTSRFYWRYALLQDRANYAGQLVKSQVPLSRASRPLRITPLSEKNTRLPLSSRPRRPCVEIYGVTGQVVFRDRISSGDKTFQMLDPAFQKAVKEGTLDKLMPGNVFAYSALGTLAVPVKVVDFPLLGQDMSGTCWVAHYREWLFYYLGTRHDKIPALQDLRSYLNLIVEPVTVERMFNPRRGERAETFEGGDSYAAKNSVRMRQHLDGIFRSVIVGVETEPHVEFNDIVRDYTALKATQKARGFSEKEFGEIMRGLLLGQMTLGRSDSHVMNILGFDGDEVMISTWKREFQGTLRELARGDPRGALLMPLEFSQHAIVARAPDGNVVIPALDVAKSPGMGELDRKEVERFNAGP